MSCRLVWHEYGKMLVLIRKYLQRIVLKTSCLLQEAMHSQGRFSSSTEEEGGRKPQDLLPHEGYCLYRSRPFGREVQVIFRGRLLTGGGVTWMIKFYLIPHCSMYCLRNKCSMDMFGYAFLIGRGMLCLYTVLTYIGDSFNSWFLTVNGFSLNQLCN